MTTHRKARGFTIVELMVVIAIIGVLVAMLMPSLRQARERAASISCLSKLRQIMVATTAYSSGNYVPQAQNEASANYWDNILFNDQLLDNSALQCPKAVKQSGIAYIYDSSWTYNPNFGRIVNSRFRQAVPANNPDGSQAPNSNYVCNGGSTGGGLMDVSIYGTFGTTARHPFRTVITAANLTNPTYQPNVAWNWPAGTLSLNGYQAFSRPLKTSELRRPDSTIAYQDGGFQSGADYIAPRHGGFANPDEQWAINGTEFNVAWFDGHCSLMVRSSTLITPWSSYNIKLWHINPDG